jgi:hypothetical protein
MMFCTSSSVAKAYEEVICDERARKESSDVCGSANLLARSLTRVRKWIATFVVDGK